MLKEKPEPSLLSEEEQKDINQLASEGKLRFMDSLSADRKATDLNSKYGKGHEIFTVVPIPDDGKGNRFKVEQHAPRRQSAA